MIGHIGTARGGGAHFAFTDRWGGVSAAPYDGLNLGGAVGDDPAAVLANRDRAARALGRDPRRVVWMHQVHGRKVAVVDAPWGESEPPAVDALVTTRPDLTLAVLTADCVPVLLADPRAGVAAAAHAGRPGLVAGVVPAAVAAMIERGARADRITALLGPSVCGACYEVPASLRAEVAAAVPEAYAVTRAGTPAVDVAAGVRAQLARAGVRVADAPAVCTLESTDHFSYRREHVTGRLAGYVWLSGDGGEWNEWDDGDDRGHGDGADGADRAARINTARSGAAQDGAGHGGAPGGGAGHGGSRDGAGGGPAGKGSTR